MRSFSHAQCGQAFLPVHLASNTGGVRLTTFSIAKSRKPIKNCSTGPSLLFFGRKIKVALVGIPALFGMPIFLWRRYAPVFEVEPFLFALARMLPPPLTPFTPRPWLAPVFEVEPSMRVNLGIPIKTGRDDSIIL